MSNHEVKIELDGDIPVIAVSGYCQRPAGLAVLAAAQEHARAGRRFVVLDLAPTEVLASPGISTIVELALELTDSFGGRLVLCGLDKLKLGVLQLVGVPTMAEIAADRPAANAVARRLVGAKA